MAQVAQLRQTKCGSQLLLRKSTFIAEVIPATMAEELVGLMAQMNIQQQQYQDVENNANPFQGMGVAQPPLHDAQPTMQPVQQVNLNQFVHEVVPSIITSTIQGIFNARPTTSSSSMKLKTNTLDTFDGSQPYFLYQWLEDCYNSLLAHNESPDSITSIMKVSTYLKGIALRKFNSRKAQDASFLSTWATFKKGLLTAFGLYTNKMASIDALIHLCSKRHTNYGEFEYTFDGLLHTIMDGDHTVLTEAEQLLFVQLYRKGIPSSLLDIAAEYQGDDLAGLKDHISHRIQRNPELIQSTLHLSPQSAFGPTPMELGFTRMRAVATANTIEQVQDHNEAEVSYIGRGRGRSMTRGRGNRGRGNSFGFSRSFSRGRGRYNNNFQRYNNNNNNNYTPNYNRGRSTNYRGRNSYVRGRRNFTHNKNNRPTPMEGVEYSYTQDGKPICAKCNKPGHIAKYCRTGKQRQANTIHVPQASSHNQASTSAQAHVSFLGM